MLIKPAVKNRSSKTNSKAAAKRRALSYKKERVFRVRPAYSLSAIPVRIKIIKAERKRVESLVLPVGFFARLAAPLTKITAAFLIISLNWFGLSAVLATRSYFNDIENSFDNQYSAGSLYFSLLPSSWEAAQKADALMPDDSVSKTISILNNGSLGFQYNASTTVVGGDADFCGALNLEARLEGAVVYSGLLKDFISSNYIFSDLADDWAFRAILAFDAPEEMQNKTCEFKFVYSGWQENLSFGSGFYYAQEDVNILSSGVWIVLEPAAANVSPIADAYASQDHAGTNYGNSNYLDVRSKEGSKNKRAFVRFDFRFPAGTEIISSLMRLYLQDAPSNSRSYEVRAVEGSWLENTINWNNQPGASSTVTDTISGISTSGRWLSWNVSGDVKNFVSGAYQNYGWRIGDAQEDSGSNEGKFISRDNSGDPEKRPILDVVFKAQPATTTHPVINEVYYDVDGTKGNNTHNEWVEIYNPTDSPVDISGWKICDNGSCDTIPAADPIPARGFALIANRASTWTSYWTVPAGAIKIALGSEIGNGLGNSGDRIYLKDAADSTIDKMSFGSDVSVFVLPNSGEGKSLARIVKGHDNDSAADWIINAAPNPGTNPAGDDGIETMRFTDEGIEVVAGAQGFPDSFGAVEDLTCPVEENSNLSPDISEEVLPETNYIEAAPVPDLTGAIGQEPLAAAEIEEIPISGSEPMAEAEIPSKSEITTDQVQEQTGIGEQSLVQEVVESVDLPTQEAIDGSQETAVLETAPALEEQPAIVPSSDSAGEGAAPSNGDAAVSVGADSAAADNGSAEN